MKNTQQRIIELLIECQGKAEASSSRKEELNDLLRDSEENREFAARFLMDGESLSDLLATREISEISSSRSGQRPLDSRASSGRGRWWPGLAGAAALVLLAAFGFWKSQSNDVPMAVVLDAAGGPVGSALQNLGAPLLPGAFELESGLVMIGFKNGVEMTVRAPSRFEIIDEFHVVLHEGSVRAAAPESGHGFTIETESARLVDLGTEFGVSVDADSGESQVHVFDGEVNVEEKQGTTELASLNLGDAARILEGQVETILPPQPGTFPSPNELGLTRWQSLDAELKEDEDLVLYYRFVPEEGDPSILRDESGNDQPIHGRISGARWVTGRWPGKSALLFDNPGDAVELEIDRELPQLTFSAWIKVDRHEYPLAPILNSHGWEEGDLHIQYSRSSGVFFAGVYHGIRMEEQLQTVPLGKWVHVAAVVDMVNLETRSWINGKPAAVHRLKPTAEKCSPGFSRLGHWEADAPANAPRGFRGRMDEVAIWSRILNDEEIQQLALIGRP